MEIEIDPDKIPDPLSRRTFMHRFLKIIERAFPEISRWKQ